MGVLCDEAVVLRRLDYSETSQVLVLLTRAHGQVRVIAKGVKRSTKTRFATGIDLLDVGTLAFSTGRGGAAELATLTEWTQTRVLSDLRRALPRLHGALYAAEVTAAMTADWDPHPGLHEALLTALESLNTARDPLPPLVAFLARLLDEVGLAPCFERCVGCHRPVDATPGAEGWCFSSFEGGLLCRDCEGAHVEKRGLAAPGLAVLRGRPAASPAAWPAAFDLLNYHLSHLMGRRPLLADKVRPAPDPAGQPAS